MTRTPLDTSGADVAGLEAALRDAVDAEVRFDAGSRGAYATDGSNYRQVPVGVVIPHRVEARAQAVQVCARFGAPVLPRGGGTSLAPRTSTHSHCALGGMIGNNSCGAAAQAYGQTVDNVRRLEVLTYDGTRMWVGPTPQAERARIAAEGDRRAELYAGLDRIVPEYLADIRRGYPKIPRRVSGYNLDSLLPENGFDVARALVGSEGTLVTVLHAELDLVPVPAYQSLLVLGYDDICTAADDVPRLLEHFDPSQLEALDGRMAQLMREEGAHLESLEVLPAGDSWLMVQFGGDSQDDVDEQAHALLRAVARAEKDGDVAFSDDIEREQRMLKAREAGLGVTARPPDDRETWEGWEDSAVPPERLGDYLRDLKKLFGEFGYDHPSLYGHFGQGGVHTRIPFGLRTAEGVAGFRRFLERAADLVVSYGGSLSGEHGDGQSRGELLTRMFGERLVAAFGELKALFDPGNRMNPGKVVHPNPVDGQLRLGSSWRPKTPATHFDYPEDDHSFNRAVMRCVGIGNCRSHSGGVMCPSYRATREEEHSTRGRARLLFEMLDGHADSAVTDGWRSTEVRDALDLCLACKGCKGCKSDCPTGVDMATLKAEFLSHHYEGRVRPAAHYSMGWLPVWARLSRIAPRLVNSALHAPGPARAGKRLAGVDEARRPPVFARQSFLQWWRAHDLKEPDPVDPRTVLLWPDTFSTYFHPSIAISAVRVLEDAGFRVAVPTRSVCCGLTWISTGQLPFAQKVLRRALDILSPYLEAGTPIVGLEPSCTAVFRSDAPELMPADPGAQRLARQVRTFVEHLVHHAPEGWQPPQLARQATVQTHCHQHAIMKFDADRELMRRAHLDADVLDEGCCGLAGNFGFERGHHRVSMAVGESGVLPAVRVAAPDSPLLADGFSCRTQIEEGGAGRRRALYLAEVLALGLDGTLPSEHPERLARRPGHPSRTARWATTAGATALTAAAAAAAGRATLHSLRRPRRRT